ncbi:MAG: enoyl-CoA hydratase [Phycisphaerales bacterium]|nr:enoyl-CoA hydratase [Phycisphaerales bacterium]
MNKASPPCITREIVGSILTITLARPETRNALSTEMFDALEGAVALAQQAAQRGEIHVVVIAAAGSAFCAGFDLSEAVASPRALGGFVIRLGGLIAALRSLDAIVVARVQGAALAGGCALVASCDIVCASEQASFGYPTHRIGISPAVSLPTLVASAGAGAARLLAISGEIVDARRALALGLVHQIAPDGDALVRLVGAVTDDLASKGPCALRETKRWLNRVDGTGGDGALSTQSQAATKASADLCDSEESRALLADFWALRKDAR